MVIEVFPYTPQWALDFEAEAQILQEALADQDIELHHVGSTSVPGMIAKPIIDIILVAQDRDATIGALTDRRYSFKGEWNIPLQGGFTKREGVNVNLHAFFGDHPEVELNLTFRNYLRAHPEARDLYSRTKQMILQDPQAQSREGKLGLPNYTKMKRAVIDQLLQEAGFNRLRLLKCLTAEEKGMAQMWRAKAGRLDEAPEDLFETREDEHLILYKGVENIGYAHVRFDRASRVAELRTLIVSEGEPRAFFEEAIQTWAHVHQYRFSDRLRGG